MLGDFRSRIKFSPEIIQKVVVQTAFYTFRNSADNLYVRCLYFNDGEWRWDYNWLDNDWNDNNPAVLLATLFISPLIYWRSFVLARLNYHSILPTFFQFRLIFQKFGCICYYPKILFPIVLKEIFLKYRFF